MSTLSENNRLIVPEDSDVLDPAGIYGAFANSADSIMVPRYASAAARDSANATAGRVLGQVCAILDSSGEQQLQIFNGVDWEMVDDIKYVMKQSNTDRASTIVPVADPVLTTSLLPNSSYIVTAHLYIFSGSSAPDLKVAWGTTGSPTLVNRINVGPSTGTTAYPDYHMVRQSNRPLATEVIYEVIVQTAGSGNHHEYVKEVVVLTTTGAATLSLLWSQANSNVSPVTISSGSHLEVRRIA